jgi:hypothetical protein
MVGISHFCCVEYIVEFDVIIGIKVGIENCIHLVPGIRFMNLHTWILSRQIQIY